MLREQTLKKHRWRGELGYDKRGHNQRSREALAIDPNDTSVIYAGTISGGDDSFVAKIDPTGTVLVYSTYLGGTRNDRANAIAVDGQGNVYVTGQTSSFDFPLESAMQSSKLGGLFSYDAFVIKLDSVGGLIFSTYLGGSGDDIAWSIALDIAGGIYIAGSTTSDDFPLLDPLQSTRNGPSNNGFVTKIVNSSTLQADMPARFGGIRATRNSKILLEKQGLRGVARVSLCKCEVEVVTCSRLERDSPADSSPEALLPAARESPRPSPRLAPVIVVTQGTEY